MPSSRGSRSAPSSPRASSCARGTPVADAAGEELHLARDVLDAQIVDVAGRRVRRVSDVELARSGDTLRAVAVDVGWVGIARRLGLGRLALGPRHDLFDWGDLHYLSFGSVIGVAALIVLIPGAPLISILFLTQALNAVLLLPLLWFIRGIAGDRLLMGEAAVGRVGAAASAVVLVLVSVSVALLLGLSL